MVFIPVVQIFVRVCLLYCWSMINVYQLATGLFSLEIFPLYTSKN